MSHTNCVWWPHFARSPPHFFRWCHPAAIKAVSKPRVETATADSASTATEWLSAAENPPMSE